MATTESRFYRQYRGQVIAISQKVERELREFYGVRSEIKIIPHGVDTSRFSGRNRETYCGPVRAEFGIGAEQIIALYVGDLTKAHTHLKTLAACAPEVQFIIVSRSSQYRWNMPNVRFLPPTTELERYYAAADAFVFPTTYDAFGMVVLEAMASGLAVLSSDRAGAAELIDSGRDGFVAPLDEWVEASAERLRNRAQLQEIGRAAEQTARQHDWLSVVNAVEQIYFEVAV